jgi:hypothetical protein
MYRPRESACLMRSLGVPFCSVCAQTYVKVLYDGGWGVPASGIDPIEPGSESPPVGTVPVGSSQLFSVDALSPAGGPAAVVEWRVNNVVQAGQTASSFNFSPPGNGTFAVKVTVRDATTLVHPSLAGGSLTSSREWSAEVTTLLFRDGFESGNTSAWTATIP